MIGIFGVDNMNDHSLRSYLTSLNYRFKNELLDESDLCKYRNKLLENINNPNLSSENISNIALWIEYLANVLGMAVSGINLAINPSKSIFTVVQSTNSVEELADKILIEGNISLFDTVLLSSVTANFLVLFVILLYALSTPAVLAWRFLYFYATMPCYNAKYQKINKDYVKLKESFGYFC